MIRLEEEAEVEHSQIWSHVQFCEHEIAKLHFAVSLGMVVCPLTIVPTTIVPTLAKGGDEGDNDFVPKDF